MSAEIREGVVVATERIQAPPDVVFPYFTDPELIVEWIGQRAELDPRPGGEFFLDMGAVSARGTYLAVEPPRRVVFTWGVPGDETLPVGSSVVEVLLTADGEGTLVELTHRDLPESQRPRHRDGWQHQLAGLDAYVSSRRPAS